MKKQKLMIEISGGKVVTVASTIDVEVVVINHDNLSQPGSNKDEVEIPKLDVICNHRAINDLINDTMEGYDKDQEVVDYVKKVLFSDSAVHGAKFHEKCLKSITDRYLEPEECDFVHPTLKQDFMNHPDYTYIAYGTQLGTTDKWMIECWENEDDLYDAYTYQVEEEYQKDCKVLGIDF